MGEIARATHNYNEYPKLFQMLWKRLTDVEHVMHVQKALILCEYLLRQSGQRSEGQCRAAREQLAMIVRQALSSHQQQPASKRRSDDLRSAPSSRDLCGSSVCVLGPRSGHGSERFVSDARRRSRDIAALVKYKHYDENNQDDAKEGANTNSDTEGESDGHGGTARLWTNGWARVFVLTRPPHIVFLLRRGNV